MHAQPLSLLSAIAGLSLLTAACAGDNLTLPSEGQEAHSLVMVSGNLQEAPVGTALPAALVVRVTDESGKSVAGITVNWSAGGGGSVSAASTVTDVNGEASVQRILGPTAGPQTASASAIGPGGSPLLGSPVVFNHTATQGNAARVIVVDGNGQEAAPGATLPERLVVQVLDAENNPVVDRPVTWVVGLGGGTVNPETSNTDSQGLASTEWTLGPQPGQNTVSAVVSGVGIGEFSATATLPKTSSSTSIVSHEPEPSIVGQAVQVQVQVSGSSGTPTGIVTVSGENASAPCTITLSNGAGGCSLTFNAQGRQRITATYNGDALFNGSEDDENHRVEQAPPQNNPPTAMFNPPTNCVAGQPCQFNDASTDSDGSVVGWSWDFGDGGSSDQKDPTHVFAEARSYEVKLTVRDDDGATSEVTHTVTVSAPVNNPPTAVADNYTTTAGEALFVDAAAGLLANDVDPEGGSLSVQSHTQPVTGIVNVGADGAFQYFPGSAASGTQESFSYTMTDGTSTATATVTITIQ